MRRQWDRAGGRPTYCAVAAVMLVLASLAMSPRGVAHAGEPSGSLSFLPATGYDTSSVTAVSSGTCTDVRGGYLQLRISGSGFPDNTNVTPALSASIYPIDPTSSGYDVPLQNTLQAFAAQQNPPAALSGTYRFSLVCRGRVNGAVFGLYTGSLTFSSHNTYHSVVRLPAGAQTAGPAAITTPALTTNHATASTVHPSLPASHNSGTPDNRRLPVTASSSAAAADTTPSDGASPAGHPQPLISSSVTLPPARPTFASTTGRSSPRPVPPSSSVRVSAGHSNDTSAAAAKNRAGVRRSPFSALVISLAGFSCCAVLGLGMMTRRRVRSRDGTS